MTALETAAALPSLEHLRGQISALADAGPKELQAGHLDLGEGLWLSCDPSGRARMALRPGADGLELELQEGDSGRWCCLGMRLEPSALAQARYAGLLLALRSAGLVTCSPALRYFLPEGGFRDVAAAPLLLGGGARAALAHMPVDRQLAARASGCEMNLFFLDDAFAAEDLRLEPLLML